MIDKERGKRLRERREQMNLRIDELARMIGADESAIEALEQGNSDCSEAELSSVCACLGVSEEYCRGTETLQDIVERDNIDAQRMLSVLETAFQALPYHTLRVAIFSELRCITNVAEWTSAFKAANELTRRYA